MIAAKGLTLRTVSKTNTADDWAAAYSFDEGASADLDIICPAVPGIAAGLGGFPPRIVLCGQYTQDPKGRSRLFSVGAAANFGLRDPEADATVAVIFPPASAPGSVLLAHLVALVLREAAVSPGRFQAVPLTVSFDFAASNAWLAYPMPSDDGHSDHGHSAWQTLAVSNLAGETFALMVRRDDLGRRDNLRPPLGFSELDRIADGVDSQRPHVSSPVAGQPAAFHNQDRERWINLAAQQAERALLLCMKTPTTIQQKGDVHA